MMMMRSNGKLHEAGVVFADITAGCGGFVRSFQVLEGLPMVAADVDGNAVEMLGELRYTGVRHHDSLVKVGPGRLCLGVAPRWAVYMCPASMVWAGACALARCLQSSQVRKRWTEQVCWGPMTNHVEMLFACVQTSRADYGLKEDTILHIVGNPPWDGKITKKSTPQRLRVSGRPHTCVTWCLLSGTQADDAASSWQFNTAMPENYVLNTHHITLNHNACQPMLAHLTACAHAQGNTQPQKL
jgi:hypothetical protein